MSGRSRRVRAFANTPRSSRYEPYRTDARHPSGGKSCHVIANPSDALTEVLAQGERVKGLVEQSAHDLTSVNEALRQQLSEQQLSPEVSEALAVNEATEQKVDDASLKLTQMNRALRTELRGRSLLEHQFAAATEQEQAARHAAFHDVLTGLPNRALLDDRLEQGIAQAHRHQWTLAVLFLDLDRFKAVNDTHAHDAGDAILKAVASRLKENARADDTVCRYGGDEFLYLLVDTGTHQNIATIADKLVKALQAPIEVGSGDRTKFLNVAASIGISIFPKDGATAAALIKCADAAMYCAKHEKSGYSFAP